MNKELMEILYDTAWNLYDALCVVDKKAVLRSYMMQDIKIGDIVFETTSLNDRRDIGAKIGKIINIKSVGQAGNEDEVCTIQRLDNNKNEAWVNATFFKIPSRIEFINVEFVKKGEFKVQSLDGDRKYWLPRGESIPEYSARDEHEPF